MDTLLSLWTNDNESYAWDLKFNQPNQVGHLGHTYNNSIDGGDV